MDDLTQVILASHAAVLEHLASGQAAIAQGLQAIAGVLDRQQAEGSATSISLRILVDQIKDAQAKAEAHRQASAERMAQIKKTMGELRAP
jgi:hypothetical protein